MKTLTKPQKILAVMFDLNNGKSTALSYEDIVVAAYEKYPNAFHLRGYPQYPNSSDIHKPLYDMKKKGLVRIADKTFELTERGLDVAQQLFHSKATDTEQLTRQEEHEINRIVKSAAFRLYGEQKLNSILDTDFYEYLGVSVRTGKGDFCGRLSNVNHAVQAHASKRSDELSAALKELHTFLMSKFGEEVKLRK
jgi:hypothetical protein